MNWFPFICLGIGFVIGIQRLSKELLTLVDSMITITLISLMFIIGSSIGVDQMVMKRLGIVGFNCAILALLAIAFSVVLVYIVERTILPLEQIKNELLRDNLSLNDEVEISDTSDDKTSPLVWIMPISIILGILVGCFILPKNCSTILSRGLTISLIILYVGVGISLGTNRSVFKYVSKLGYRIVYISLAIFIGSILAGIVGSILLNIPYNIAITSVSGMSYYSITGAFMTNAYGIEGGTYGFIVNVMREFFTVLMLPFLIKISKGSPIAGGAAGNMDTMLAPITKFVGIELGLVTLITGTILTFAVPFILPLLYQILA